MLRLRQMDLTFLVEKGAFNVRVGAIVIAEGRLLLQGDRRFDFLVPPGGRLALHEATRDALARELREELAREPSVGKLLWIVENFFDHNGVTVHELGFLYEANLSTRDPLRGIRGDFRGPENEPSIFFRWVPLPELGSLLVYPRFLRALSAVLPDVTQHVIIDERQSRR